MANERLNHDATFSGFVPTMIYCGADTSLIDNVYCPTGFYNIEQAPEGHRLPDGNPYYRVIVLGDHKQTPTGFATEIAIGYLSGRLWAPYIRTSNPAGWTEWTKLTEI